MKKIIILSLLILLLETIISFGQSTYIDRYALKYSSIDFMRKFKCDIASGEVVVVGGNDDSIKIVAEVYNAPGKNYTCSDDGCMIVDDNFFRFSIKPREGEKIKTIKVILPYELPVCIDLVGCGSVSISKMEGEIQINSRRLGNIELNKVKGPLSISGTYGDITVNFIPGVSKKPMAISLVKGNINLNFSGNEGVTIASLCPDEKSSLKDYPVKSIVSLKNRKDTLKSDPSRFETRKISIAMNYKERIETRKDFGHIAKSKKQKNPIFLTQDAWVYDINGGGTSIDVQVWSGSIKVGEIKD